MIALCANNVLSGSVHVSNRHCLLMRLATPFLVISAFVLISGAFWSGEIGGHSMTETLNMSPTLSFVLHYCHTDHANTAQVLNFKYFPIGCK